MATTTISWGDGSGDNIYFTADAMEGNQEVLVSSDANAGDERTKTVTFSAQGAEPKSLGIIQLGSGGTSEFDDWVKDGDTHLWLNILNDYQLEQQISIRMIGTIDWGDGSAKETANVTAYTTFTHTYSEKGKYRIDLHPTSGTFYIGRGGTSGSVMGAHSNSAIWRTSALYQVEVGTDIITTLTTCTFYYCIGLQRVYIPKTITGVNQQLFANDSALTQVEFEDWMRISGTVTSTNMFYGCYALQDISDWVINPGTTLNTAFRVCHSLCELTIHKDVTSIVAAAFQNDYGLKRLFCLPTTAPSVANANAFTGFPTDCVIVVPTGSLSSYQGKSIWSTYSSQMVEGATISFTLSSVTSSNKHLMSLRNVAYATTLTPDSGKTLGTVTVKMGGTDVTSTAYSAGVVTIASVTGNIEITATAS